MVKIYFGEVESCDVQVIAETSRLSFIFANRFPRAALALLVLLVTDDAQPAGQVRSADEVRSSFSNLEYADIDPECSARIQASGVTSSSPPCLVHQVDTGRHRAVEAALPDGVVVQVRYCAGRRCRCDLSSSLSDDRLTSSCVCLF